MELTIIILICLYYLSILLEIVLIPVPSVASTYQLVFPSDEIRAVLQPDSLLFKIQQWGWPTKIVVVILPYMISTLAYCWPLVFIFLDKMGYLHLDLNSYVGWMVLGIALLVVGRWITLSSTWAIRQNNSQEGGEFDLKTEGIFRRSRNPIALGLHVGMLGMNLIFPSVYFALATVVYLCNIHFRILLEEDFLLHMFREEYPVYLSKTRRYL